MEALSAADYRRLALAAERENRPEEAVSAWRELLWLDPHDHAAALSLTKLYAAQGEIKPALELLQASLRKAPEHAGLHQALGRLWLEMAEWDKAERHFAQAGDEAGLATVQSARGNLPQSYARHLFNDYAPNFDTALSKLGYQAPQLIAQALQPLLTGKAGLSVIDLGCGTGLMAPYLRPHAARLVGVDIAEKMLEQARCRGSYDELIHGDMTAALTDAYDLIVAADALVYVGDLAALLQAVSRTLKGQGVFAATVEVNGLQEGFVLQESRRYAHSQSYIEGCSRQVGLRLTAWTPAVLRQDRGQPVNGAILILTG
jgi:predicted TPR repeat methyltransferase